MFKPNDLALIFGTDRVVTVISQDVITGMVQTSEGVYAESALRMGHPSVLQNASGVQMTSEEYWQSRPAPTPPLLDADLRERVQEALAKIPLENLDLKGHWESGRLLHSSTRENLQDMSYWMARNMPSADAKAVVDAVETNTPMEKWVPVNARMLRLIMHGCPCCNQQIEGVETNGQSFRLAADPCPYPNGLPATEWELNVPSGYMIVANDLREHFPLPHGEDYDINKRIGLHLTTLAYAKQGLSHAFVGNTCPSVFKCADNTFKIGKKPHGQAWDGKKWVKVKTTKWEGRKVAGICTDLWWYSICDAEEYQRRMSRFGDSDRDIEKIKVKPGVYRFTHSNQPPSEQEEAEQGVAYSRFEWIREPDPVVDFLSQYDEVEVNPHAYVQAQAQAWPTLFGRTQSSQNEAPLPWSEFTPENKQWAWQRVADQIFCTIGGGTEWHEKGFPRASTDPTIQDVEPPAFRQQCHWYPFSRPYGGLFEPQHLSPSFAKVAFRVLESVISFGMTVQDGSHSRDVLGARERMLLAVQRYREMAQQYPEQADPEYVQWLHQPGRAEQWVAQFDLGPVFTDKHREHAARQRWIPEDAYAIEFDASKLTQGFHTNGKTWATAGKAKGYSPHVWMDNEHPEETNCFWTTEATTFVPLVSIVRVVRLGTVSHMGDVIVEIAYDYGTPWMQDASVRKGVREMVDRAAIRVLTKAEYEARLEQFRTPPEVVK